MLSEKGVENISNIELRITYGYAPNVRTIIQTISSSDLKNGLNSIKIDNPILAQEIKANPELKVYPSLVIAYNNGYLPDDISGNIYSSPLSLYKYKDNSSINIFTIDNTFSMSFPQLNNINPHFNDSFYKIGYEDITDYNILNNNNEFINDLNEISNIINSL